MNCSANLDFLKENTPLRYEAFPKDWIKKVPVDYRRRRRFQRMAG
jgi:hypothetical protein